MPQDSTAPPPDSRATIAALSGYRLTVLGALALLLALLILLAVLIGAYPLSLGDMVAAVGDG